MLGRGILAKTVFGNCFLMSLKKSPDDVVKVEAIPTVEEVVKFLRQPTKERTKEDITYIGRFFAQK